MHQPMGGMSERFFLTTKMNAQKRYSRERTPWVMGFYILENNNFM
jgi:hypothetical protein